MMENLVEKLTTSSTKHKNGIVTDFGIDNISLIFGVYANLALAVLIVVQGAIKTQIVCHQNALKEYAIEVCVLTSFKFIVMLATQIFATLKITFINTAGTVGWLITRMEHVPVGAPLIG